MKARAARSLFFAATVVLCVITSQAQNAAHNAAAIWRIGAFDRASIEFAGGSPEKPVSFATGESDPAKDWFAVQRVRLAASSAQQDVANGSGPWTIHFTLQQAPAASYTLHVALLLESPSVPTLVVSINGKRGRFYVQPRSNTEAGEHNGATDAVNARADVRFDFPGAYLHPGANTLTLEAVEDAANHDPDASLTYDAIELDRSNSPVDASSSSVRLMPTIFYQQQQGRLVERVDCVVRYAGPPARGASMDLAIDSHHQHRAFAREYDFGEEKLEFAVPEFAPHTQVQLGWQINGAAQHKQQWIDPAKKWTLFLVPHIHLDIGYSDYQAKVAAIQSRVIDEALQLSAQHPDFHFSLDGEWSLEQFLKTRTPAEQQLAIEAIKKRQLFVPAQYANLLTGFATAELLLRSLYPSSNFSRLHATPFDYANITDVPTYSWSYPSLLASAGIRELLAGSDNFRAPVFFAGHLNEASPMWWQGPDGEKVLTWYARHYQQMQFLFGLPPLALAGLETLPVFLQQYDRPAYHANAAIIFGTQAENTDLFAQQAELAGQWNSLYAYPHLQYAGVHEALANIAGQLGDSIPTVRGDGGPYWEDGVASDARAAAIERQNESRGPSAEKLSTLASLIDRRLAPNATDLAAMWNNMLLMDEHTWASGDSVVNPGSSETVEQLAVKDQYALQAQQLGSSIARTSMANIADSISTQANSLIVFNTLNWARSGLVSVDLENWRAQIVDAATGHPVPGEVIGGGRDFRRVRFSAQNVPALGYKVYSLLDTEKPPEPAPVAQQTSLQNSYYSVKLDPQTGAVANIYDKQLQRELVDQQSPYRFGQYLYVTGGDQAPNSLLQYSRVLAPPAIGIHPAHQGRVLGVTRTPWGWVARMESTATNTPRIATEIRLFDDEKKIEFEESIEKTEVDTKEAAYFAFPFAMDHPRFQYEIQNGVVDPARDMLPGAGYEWFSVQHWISVEQNGVAATVMPLDASLVTLGDVNRGAWPAGFGTRAGSLFSYVMNNYWTTNYRAGQGGSFRFRYVITSGPALLQRPADAVQSSRMGWQEMTPLETDHVIAQDRAQAVPRPLSGKQQGFLNVEDPGVVLTAWKFAEDGNGTILRFVDLGGAERQVNIQAPYLEVKAVWQADAVERDQQRLPLLGAHGFQFTIHPHQVVTIRLQTGAALPAVAPSGPS